MRIGLLRASITSVFHCWYSLPGPLVLEGHQTKIRIINGRCVLSGGSMKDIFYKEMNAGRRDGIS
jgi:hypothetical protein